MLLQMIDFATRTLTVISAAIIGVLAFLVSFDAITRTLRVPTIWVFDVSIPRQRLCVAFRFAFSDGDIRRYARLRWTPLGGSHCLFRNIRFCGDDDVADRRLRSR